MFQVSGRATAVSALVGAAFAVSVIGAPKAQAGIAADKLAAIHTVGVASNFADKAEVMKIGAMVFGNQRSDLDIADWGLDGLIVAEVQKELAGRFVVQPTPITINVKSTFFYQSALKEAILAQPPRNVDAYLLILGDEVQLPYPSRQRVSGAGVYQEWPGMGGPDIAHHSGEAIVHLTYTVWLLDAKTGKVIGYGNSTAPQPPHQNSFFSMSRSPRTPFVATGQAGWPTTAGALTDAQKTIVHDDLVQLVKTSVGYTLKDMSLASPDTATASGAGSAPGDKPE